MAEEKEPEEPKEEPKKHNVAHLYDPDLNYG
jgi:hypothetical protein